MRRTPLLTGIALLVFGGLASTAGGQAVPGTVSVLAANARFAYARRSGKARHTLRLGLSVSPRYLPDLHDPDEHALRMTLDGTELCNAPPGAGGYRFRRGRWRYRGRIAGGRVILRASRWSGRVTLRVSRADLSGLRAGAAAGLPLSLEIAGSLLETTADFRVVDGRVRRWAGLVRDYLPNPDPNPDPDPGPSDPPPSGGDLRDALLADLARRGVEYFRDGSPTPLGGFDAQARRCPSGNLAEVVVLAAPPPGSADFFTDTAYVCRADGQYWANRTGGFPGANLWLGPYPLP